MSRTWNLTLPAAPTLAFALEGPQGGWGWHCENGRVLVGAHEPIRHMEPTALATLAAWGAYQREVLGNQVLVDDSLKSPYAYRVGLLPALAGNWSAAPLGGAGAMLPVRRADDARSERTLVEECGRVLQLAGDREVLESATYCLSELIRNVREHAATRLGAFAAAGYFPKADRVTLAVADVGRGIPESIRASILPAASDTEAVTAALQYRVTGAVPPGMYATSNNLGAGLAFVSEICRLTGGVFAVASLGAQARSSPGSAGRDEYMSVAAAPTHWQGTLVAVSFRPSTVPELAVASVTGAYRPAISLPLQFANGEPPPDTPCATVIPDVGSFAYDKDLAIRLREGVILPALAASLRPSVDFHGVLYTTQSLVHALLYEPFRKHGEDAARAISFHRTSRQVRDLVQLVAGYALDDRIDR